MKKLLLITLIFILTINLVPTSVNDSASAQEKTTDSFIYDQGDPIEITIRVPGGTDLYTQPANIVLVLDRSVSMLKDMAPGQTVPRIKTAVAALKGFLDAADPTKHRIALATFGSGGYWHTNFSTNYTAIRNKLNNLESEIIANKAGAFAGWECTSNGDGLRLAVDKLTADTDTDPDYVILASDGAENGQLHQVDSVTGTVFWNITGHTSSFIENNNAVVDAKSRGITIHTIGISKEIDEDYSGTFSGIPKDSEAYLGRKCGRIYHPTRHGNLGWRSGEKLLRDHIAAPTGGTYSRVVKTADLENVYTNILDDIASDYDIRVYDQIRSDIFNNITAIDPTPGCSGDDKYVAGSLIIGADNHGFKDARYNQLEKGEEACIKISTTVKTNAITGLQDVDVRHGSCPAATIPADSGCIRILTTNTWLDKLKAKIDVKLVVKPWLKTGGGNVGAHGIIDMIQAVPSTNRLNPEPRHNASYLVTANGSITNFTSHKEWELTGYDADLYGPIYDATVNNNKGGYDFYNYFRDRAKNKIVTWTKPNELPGCTDMNGCFYQYKDNSAYTLTKATTTNSGPEPIVFFIPGNLHMNNLILFPGRPMIWIVQKEIKSNVVNEGIIKLICNIFGGDCKQARQTTMHGFFIANGEFSTLNADGFTMIFGGVVANEINLNGGSSLGGLNQYIPAEVIRYDPTILWVFKSMLGESRTIYREVAP